MIEKFKKYRKKKIIIALIIGVIMPFIIALIISLIIVMIASNGKIIFGKLVELYIENLITYFLFIIYIEFRIYKTRLSIILDIKWINKNVKDNNINEYDEFLSYLVDLINKNKINIYDTYVHKRKLNSKVYRDIFRKFIKLNHFREENDYDNINKLIYNNFNSFDNDKFLKFNNKYSEIINQEFIKVNNEKYVWNKVTFGEEFEKININNLAKEKFTILNPSFPTKLINFENIEDVIIFLEEFPISFSYNGKIITIDEYSEMSYLNFIIGICYFYFYKLKNIKFDDTHRLKNLNISDFQYSQNFEDSNFDFTNEEWELLQNTLLKILYEIANADGLIDDFEITTFNILINGNYEKLKNQLFKEITYKLKETIDFDYLYFNKYIKNLDLEKLLFETNTLIVKKLSNIEVIGFKISVVILAYHIAKSSRETIFSKSVSKEESILIEKIIKFLNLNNNDLIIYEKNKNYNKKFKSLLNITMLVRSFIFFGSKFIGKNALEKEDQLSFVNTVFGGALYQRTNLKSFEINKETYNRIITDINNGKYKTFEEVVNRVNEEVGGVFPIKYDKN